MKFICGLHNLHADHHGCVLTIGNFDGIHRGHQAVLAQLARIGKEMRLPTTLVIFEPQAQEFFIPKSAPIRLTRLREKLIALRGLSLDRVCCLRFDHHLAKLAPTEFVERLLYRGLGARCIVVGDDFHFGYQREGNVQMLIAQGKRFGFEVKQMETCLVDRERVSSTRVRDALGNGNFVATQELLGRQYSLYGRIIHGDRRGRDLGFPTANINLHRRILPINGVFAVEVHGIDKQPIAGVANVGIRPTVDGKCGLLEVHLLNFNQNIYLRQVQVNFLHKFRAEKRFDSLAALKLQIAKDVESAQAYFKLR
uniref:Riboflavin biosynthesis protein n=1 Tax=Candidatus Kentrum sp. TUN TaxID=2126343 RepID=A0A450ZU55_9GAMM|nr:MAG: riboflavin kinase / FMN adenylyltransferase [Candidatus Kentron sp. TUN]VFK60180.1 MAG: riboflavin kinase / FMN adenylyltransferase [Candidatus Kentron sp. TUN]VFK65426.1 MAG: riboflavin kinase / FMN adenylyltransferase [Candidatus Kentron sp. TUN]